MTRWGNTRLGNRFPNRYGLKYDCCPAWERWGVTVQLNEAHVIFSCPVVSGQRLGLGLSDMGRGLSMCHEILQTFVGGDCAPCLYSWKGGVKWEHVDWKRRHLTYYSTFTILINSMRALVWADANVLYY